MTSISNVSIGQASHHAPAIEAITPSQAIIQDANRVEYVTDSLGRRLGVKRFSASLKRRVLKAMSAESGTKQEYFMMAMVACACVSIDDMTVPFPQSEVAIDALIDRLETEGKDATIKALAKFSPQEDGGQDVKN